MKSIGTEVLLRDDTSELDTAVPDELVEEDDISTMPDVSFPSLYKTLFFFL